MMRNVCFVAVAAVLLSACGSAPDRGAPPAGPIAVDGGAVGYQHGIERSRFSVGPSPRRVVEFGFLKLAGPEGTFAVDVENGAAMGVPNAPTAEEADAGWYTLGPDRHDAEVAAYFEGAGIAKEQMRRVHTMTSLAASGPADDPARSEQRVLGYQSAIERSIDGIPVVDSVAWARLDEKGRVLAEGVYWPAIPASVIEDARSMRDRLTKDPKSAAFLSRVPRGATGGEVVIRHSPAMVGGPFEAFASFDVLEPVYDPQVRQSTPDMRPAAWVERHYDIEGNERRLPQERTSIAADYPERKR